MTWKRLDPWWNSEDFIGARVRRMNNEALNRPDITDVEGIVIGSDRLCVRLDSGQEFLTTPYHSDSKWYVDIDSLSDGFTSDDILDNDPDHVQLYLQD